MKVDIILEIGPECSRDIILSILKDMNFIFAKNKVYADEGLFGHFRSNMPGLYVDKDMPEWGNIRAVGHSLTEDARVAGWDISSNFIFTYMSNCSDECFEEIKYFVTELDKRSKCWFVLSWQYEIIYALKGKYGLEWIKKL